MGGKSSSVTVGHRYYLGAHLVFCESADEVQLIEVGERVAWEGSIASSQRLHIDAPGLFGGEKREGGIKGDVDIAFGEPTQPVNDYLRAKIGSPMPAFRGVLAFILRQVYCSANNPYLKAWAARIKRIPRGWYEAVAEIDGGANPAHIVREVITSPRGLREPPELIDEAAFRAAADQLFAEGFGLSLAWAGGGVEQFLQTVQDHIGGALFVDPATGLYTLNLIRDGYDVESLPLFDESNILELSSYQRRTLSETVNEIKVTYTDRATGKPASLTVHDLANIAAQGAVVSQSRDYSGIHDPELAARVARRDLVSSSAQVAKVRLRLNRDGETLRPGGLLRLSWPPLGIVQMVLRIGEIDYGTPENPAVTVEAVEDVFGLPDSTYMGVQPPGWVDPVQAPSPCPAEIAMEAPYWDIVQAEGEGVEIPQDAGVLVTLGVRPTGAAYDYELRTDAGGGYAERAMGDFAPSAVLAEAVGPMDTELLLADGVDLDLIEPGGYAWLGAEAVRIDAVDGQTMSVARGVIDTVPTAHPAGARLFAASDWYAVDPTQYDAGEVVEAKLLPTTGRGQLAESLASALPVEMASRAERPYPPGRLRLGGRAYPEGVIDGATTITWAHRSRTQQTAGLIGEGEGDIGPEPGTTYTVRVYANTIAGEPLTLRETATGITGTSYTYDGPVAEVRWEVESERDGYLSWQAAQHQAEYAGYGRQYGNHYGGITNG